MEMRTIGFEEAIEILMADPEVARGVVRSASMIDDYLDLSDGRRLIRQHDGDGRYHLLLREPVEDAAPSSAQFTGEITDDDGGSTMDREIDYEEAYCLLTREPDGVVPRVLMNEKLRFEFVDLSDGRRLIRRYDDVVGSRIFVREPAQADVSDHAPLATGEITDDEAGRLLGTEELLFERDKVVRHGDHCYSVELSDGRRLVRQGDGAGGHRWILHEAPRAISGAELARALEDERHDSSGRYASWKVPDYVAVAEEMGCVVQQVREGSYKVFAVYPGPWAGAPGERPLLLIFGDYTTSRPHAWLAPVLEEGNDA